MSRGNSGRIVLEINPELKDQLYIALAKEKLTMKDWFIKQCHAFIDRINQPELFQTEVAEPKYPYINKEGS
ncbi:MAG: hypothetical protein JXB88_00395 [Spirochaetales bacterium]|nr:hypothetical protein [Spirochaetales bacterium]